MSSAGKSSLVYGIYALVLGGVFLVKPYSILGDYGMPRGCEPWIRILGMFIFVLGEYYVGAARRDLIEYFELSVFGRYSVTVFMTIFVSLGFVPKVFIVMGIIDMFAATWTLIALRSDRRSARQRS
ncbi:MAG: hypothetical protein QOH71_1058 [Blastocatellia bacterium]|jgi:hypothetical protein|nr:hypothetical protein [Blastocatellia bacterium]